MSNESPALRLSRMISGLWIPQALHAAAELGLPDALAEAPLSAAALAQRLHTHPDATERLCKALVFLELLDERDARFALTELGRCLTDSAPASRRAWARLMCGEPVWSQWGQLVECVRSGEPAAREGAFGVMERDPEASAVFHQAMVEMTRDAAPAICAALELGGVRKVVDVGGGWGALLCAVLESAPEAHGVVYDLENARQGALAQLERRGLSARGGYASGSFFDAPPPAADLYLLKSVIHDWDDARSRSILEQCRAAMSSDARLCVIEPPARPSSDKGLFGFFTAFSDLNMLVVAGGRERSEAEYRTLIEACGLRVTAQRPTRGFYHVFEAVRV
jgi:hypothetical protein